RGRAAARRPRRLPLRGALPAARGHPRDGRPRRPARPARAGAGHPAGGGRPAGPRHARRRPGRRLRGLRGVQRTPGGRGMKDLFARNVLLVDHRAVPAAPAWRIEEADDAGRRAHAAQRHTAFVAGQGLFAGTDHDAADDDPRTRVLVARAPDGTVLGGVRLGPAEPGAPDVGWWTGSRLVAAPGAPRGVGPAL